MRADTLSAVTEGIYDAGIEPARWPVALGALGSALGCNGAVLAFLDPQGRSLGFEGDGDPQALGSYVAHYRACDRVFARVTAAPPGRVWADEMVQTKAELHCSEFHADWGRKTGMEHALMAIAPASTGARGLVALARPPHRPAFDAADVDALQELLPHFRRAMAVHLRLAGASAAGEGALMCLARLGYAVFRVGPDAALTVTEAAGEALLLSGAGLRLSGGAIETARPAQGSTLRRLLGRAARPPREGGWIAIDRADGGAPLRCLVLPVGHGARERLDAGDTAALLIVDCGPSDGGREGALAALFGLTGAEARVAALTAHGEGAPAIAAAMRIAPSTVRTHLRHAFEKTGARGQTELGVMVARLAGDSPETRARAASQRPEE